MLFYFSLAILILVLVLQIIRRFGGLFGIRLTSILRKSDFPKINVNIRKSDFLKYIFIISVFIIFLLLFYQSFQQFEVWSQNELSKFLLPPYQSVSYFIFYSFFRFFAPYLISLAAALIFLFTAKFFNKKYQERFFCSEELYFGALAIFLVGHPGWLFYSVILITFYFLLFIFYFLFLKKEKRLSLYYLWIPMGIFVILIGKWLQALPIWQILKI